VRSWVKRLLCGGMSARRPRGAAHLDVLARIVEQDRAASQPEGLGDAALEQAAEDPLVDRDEEVGDVALEVEGAARPVGGDRAHLVLEAARGVERAAALDAGAAVGDEGALEARADAVVEQVVRHAVGERRRPDLARLGAVDDEADRAPGPVGAGGEALVQVDELPPGRPRRRARSACRAWCAGSRGRPASSSAKEKSASFHAADRAGSELVVLVVVVLVAVVEVLVPGVARVVGVLRSFALSTSAGRCFSRSTAPDASPKRSAGRIRCGHGGGRRGHQRRDQSEIRTGASALTVAQQAITERKQSDSGVPWPAWPPTR
jgi:hypothetical protein